MRKPNLLLAKSDEDVEIDLTMSSRALGEKRYELTNHLGNVLAVVSDKRLPNDEPDVISVSDYYPYGMLMPDRNYDAEEYRYGFNTQEKVPELNSSHTTALFWEYDGWLGRRWNIDPKPTSGISAYSCFSNSPIPFGDYLGDTIKITYKSGFLGLGKEQTLNYENGKLFNADGSDYIGKVKGFLSKSFKALNTINATNEGGSMIDELQSSSNIFTIVKGNNMFLADNTNKAYANQLQTDPIKVGTLQALQNANFNINGGSGGTIKWNPSGTILPTLDGPRINSIIDLSHELFHGLDANRGLLDTRAHEGIKRSEWQAVYRENILRLQLGLPLRTHYKKVNNLEGKFLDGAGPLMITPSKQPLLPNW